VAEQTPADDLEALLGAGRRPRGLHPTEGVLEAHKGLASRFPADLDVRLRDRGHDQGLGNRAGGLGERLGEGEVGVERPAREVHLPVEQADVGHPLVDEHQAGGRLRQDLPQGVGARAHALPVGLGHEA
jgi:hypothetical protein